MNGKFSKSSVKLSDFTTISSKGQLVIPKAMRASLGLKEGDLFAASLIENDIIILKKVSAKFTKEDENSITKIQAAWNEIDAGKMRRMSKDAFLKELQKW